MQRFLQGNLLACLLTLAPISWGAVSQLKSPDSNLVIHFRLQPDGAPAWAVQYLGKPLLAESRLGFQPGFTNGFQLAATAPSSHEGQWTWAFGERSTIPDNYHQLEVDLKHASGRLLRLTFRAYNEGAAFRYTFPQQAQTELVVSGEQTEFRFPTNTFGYEEHGTEGEYRRVQTGDIQPWCERPLTLEYASGGFASLGEAANLYYPRMLLSPLPGVPGALVSALGGSSANNANSKQGHEPRASLKPGDSTPWRLLIVGQKPGDLLERNYLMLNLNAPSALADTSWIRPGKVLRETTLTTLGAKACIDFGAQHGLSYILFDAGWYGPENDANSDASVVAPARAANLNIHEVVAYGTEKGLGVLLYVNHRALEKQMDQIFPLYEKWGIKGVKFGFVNVGSQQWTSWITEGIRKAADHHLIVNIHDGYRSTSISRTYPNLMTVEGIRGNEHMPTPEHNCTLPFARYVAGPGDYTVCYYTNRKKTTFAHQLAMSVVSFSPLQCLFWYDKPSDSRGEPELEFFQHVFTVWDETKVIHGEIGKYASIARRKGNEWFIGTINNSETRTVDLPLSFLPAGSTFTARLYSDDPAAATRTHVTVGTKMVDSQTTLKVPLLPAGGQAIWIAPPSQK